MPETTINKPITLRQFLCDESRWTKRAFARNAAGDSVPPTDPAACSRCLVGGFYVLPGTWQAKQPLYKLLMRTINELYPRQWRFHSLSHFNDDPLTTYADIIRVLDAASERTDIEWLRRLI